MPWVYATLRGQRVYARANEDGSLAAKGGRVEIRYKPNDGRRYDARADNLEVERGSLMPDETCARAPARSRSPPKRRPPAPPRRSRKAAWSPTPTARAPETPARPVPASSSSTATSAPRDQRVLGRRDEQHRRAHRDPPRPRGDRAGPRDGDPHRQPVLDRRAPEGLEAEGEPGARRRGEGRARRTGRDAPAVRPGSRRRHLERAGPTRSPARTR